MIRAYEISLFFSLTVAVLLIGTDQASALPFNDDMVDNQKRTGIIMRGLPKDSVAVGFEAPQVKSKTEAAALVNPIPAEPQSLESGKRLFQVNCYPCHGDVSSNPYKPGPVAVNSKGTIPGMDIGDKLYLDKTDGYIYGTIHFGGLAIMPGLGWKLSDTEHWDIINYLRSAQRSRLAK
jgi:mono/diheme cytochrome c family protein